MSANDGTRRAAVAVSPDGGTGDGEGDAEGIAHVDWPHTTDCAELPRDPMEALDKLTQLNGSSAVAGAHACGAVCLVAATLATRGYAGLLHLADSLRDELSDHTYAELRRLGEYVALEQAAASFGALADYALTLHRRYRGFEGGMPYDKLLHLMNVAGFRPPRFRNDDDIGGTVATMGQCWPAKIAIGGRGEGDHWILAGRDARGLFLYDPYPRDDGSQIIRPGEADWKKYAGAIGQDEDGQETIGFLPRE